MENLCALEDMTRKAFEKTITEWGTFSNKM